MNRAFSVAALAMFCWLALGARDASWARQAAVAEQAKQPPQSDNLRLLAPGTKLTVYLIDGSKLEGVLREVQDDAIVVEQKHGKFASIRLADIKRLETRSGGLHPVTRVLIIVGATLGALFVIAVATC